MATRRFLICLDCLYFKFKFSFFILEFLKMVPVRFNLGILPREGFPAEKVFLGKELHSEQLFGAASSAEHAFLGFSKCSVEKSIRLEHRWSHLPQIWRSGE
jgi:hypothetical protein